MWRHIIFAIAIAIAASASASAQTARNDYADGKSWLCRPGRQDACAVDQTATIVAADGTLKREEWKRTWPRRSIASTCTRRCRPIPAATAT